VIRLTEWDSPHAPTRPAVWVNCAASADGRLAFADGRPAPLSGPEDVRRVQQLRAEADAILVGVGTVLHDDPSLRVHWDLLGRAGDRTPLRIVLDSAGRTPAGARVLDGSLPTLVVTTRRNERRFPAHVRTLVAGDARVDLVAAFRQLLDLGVHRLMIEGGAEVLASVLREGLFDRWTVYFAPVLIGGATAPMLLRGPETPDAASVARLRLLSVERLGAGYLATYLPASASAP
jgi:2,5-diamino-6-(ribosylamino)-4(3H)-pyrimidinone 5'-phosphate reductase